MAEEEQQGEYTLVTAEGWDYQLIFIEKLLRIQEALQVLVLLLTQMVILMMDNLNQIKERALEFKNL